MWGGGGEGEKKYLSCLVRLSAPASGGRYLGTGAVCMFAGTLVSKAK